MKEKGVGTFSIITKDKFIKKREDRHNSLIE